MAKTCVICNQEKGLLEFSIDRSLPDGKRAWCRPCGRTRRKSVYSARPGWAPETQQCSSCGEEKGWDDFHKDLKRERLVRRCRKCLAAQAKQWHDANRERTRAVNSDRYYRRIYGVGVEVRDALRKRQDNCCAICSTPGTARVPLRLDHDHRTGSIRGLLCHSCNVALGHLDDSPELLQKAKEYLLEHKNSDSGRASTASGGAGCQNKCE